jgi:hypothetical protein
MTATITPAMAKKAEALAVRVPLLSRGRSKATGEAFYVIPGSKPGTAHWANASGCTCEGFRRRGSCTHHQACVIVKQHQDVDRASRQVPGAEHQPTASPTSWRPCIRKCGALLPPESRMRFCDECYTRLNHVLFAA